MVFKGLQFVSQDVNFGFIKLRFVAYALSALLVIASIALLFTRGLNFGVDFTGGMVVEIQVSSSGTPDLQALRGAIADAGLEGASLQEFGAPNDLLIRMPGSAGSVNQVQQDKLASVFTALYGAEGFDVRRTEFVGPQVGEELKKQGFNAVLFSLLGIMAYVWFRFEWQFGVASVVALLHDTISILGFFALTQIEFNLSTVAAILMVAGYSINDTVVVFDRIREDLRRYKKKPLPELFNLSINQMLARTIMTSFTTLLALFALYFFGGEVLRGFISALMVGIVVGTYSSIFVAAPLLLPMKIRRAAFDVEAKKEQA